MPSSEVQQNSPAGPQADRGPGPGPREALDSRDPRTESVEVIPTTVAPGNVDAVDTVQHEAANPMEDEATSDPGDDEVTDAGSLPIPGDDEASPHLASSDANRSVLARGSGQQ